MCPLCRRPMRLGCFSIINHDDGTFTVKERQGIIDVGVFIKCPHECPAEFSIQHNQTIFQTPAP